MGGNGRTKFTLVCAQCERTELPERAGRKCSECGGSFVVEIDRSTLEPGSELPLGPGLPGMWRYLPLLPVTSRESVVSLHEGRTPWIPSEALAAEVGIARLWLKDESRNPTGSFKDRMVSVGVSRAVELGERTVVVQSSGNVAAAAAAYAAKAGLASKIFVPRSVPEEKLVQIQMYGGELFRIDHDSPAAVFELMDEAARSLDWHVVATTALYNPYTLEGAKTIAYEIFEQSKGELPDWMIVPVGGGGNLGGLWRGFRELRELGLVDRLPRMAGVQAQGCAPFVEAVRLGRSVSEATTLRWPTIDTVCGPIADDVVFDAHIALPAVRDSGGTAVAVSDEETLDWERRLASREGLFVEPSSATTLAALARLVEDGLVARESSVGCILTGTGFKDVQAAKRLVPLPDLIEPTARAVLSRARARA